MNKAHLRMYNLFADSTDATALIPVGDMLKFQVSGWVNTLELPSINYFYIVTGYTAATGGDY